MFDLNNLNNDYFDKLGTQDILDIKSLDFNDKITCFKFFLNTDHITNISVLSNLFLLLNGFNGSYKDSLGSNITFFNSLEEYVDIKVSLKEELDKFCVRILEHYLSIVAGLDTKLPELKYHIPNTYFCLFSLINPIVISKLMVKFSKLINLDNIKPAECADLLYSNINNSNTLMLDFLEKLTKDN